MKKFTIGIPTYNRASILPTAIEAALSQTYQNLEIIVCDNASTDETKNIVASYDDPRLVYIRNDHNIGASRNFARTVELATGTFFSWLQDDDLIFPNFVQRASEILNEPSTALYMAYATYGPSRNALSGHTLIGPPAALHWGSGGVRRIDAWSMLALSQFLSVAIPPVVAFRRTALLGTLDLLTEDKHVSYVERTLQCRVASGNNVVADSAVMGVFYNHANQYSNSVQSESNDLRNEWLTMAEYLDRMFDATAKIPEDSVFHQFVCNTAPLQLHNILFRLYSFNRLPPLSERVCETIRKHVSDNLLFGKSTQLHLNLMRRLSKVGVASARRILSSTHRRSLRAFRIN